MLWIVALEYSCCSFHIFFISVNCSYLFLLLCRRDWLLKLTIGLPYHNLIWIQIVSVFISSAFVEVGWGLDVFSYSFLLQSINDTNLLLIWSGVFCLKYVLLNKIKKPVYYVTPCDKLYSVQFNFQLTRFAEKVFVVVVFINGVWDAQLMCIVVVTTWTLVPGLIQKGDFLIQLFHVQFVLKKSKTVKTDLVFPCT